jgi:hypothetical protein
MTDADALPTAREYVATEWPDRGWLGRVSLPLEAVAVVVLRALAQTTDESPNLDGGDQ